MERIGAPAYENALAGTWIAAMPEVAAALTRGVDAADVGCGAGRAIVALARAFPSVPGFVGDDTNPAQLARARANVPPGSLKRVDTQKP